jgi:hypothetical protein
VGCGRWARADVNAHRAGALRSLKGRGRWPAAYAFLEISIPFPLIAAGEQHVDSSLAAIIGRWCCAATSPTSTSAP